MSEFDISKIIIKTDLLGVLICKNIIAFYDYPRIILTESSSGLLYVMSEYKVTKNSYSWFVCETTAEDVKLLNERKISLREFYFKASKLLIVEEKRDAGFANCIIVGSVPSDCFVEDPLFLDGFLDSPVNEEHLETVCQVSENAGSTVVSFRAEKEKKDILSVSVEKVKAIIEKFKKLFSAFGLDNKQSLCFSRGSTLVNIIIEDDTSDLSVDNHDDVDLFINTFKGMVSAETEDDLLIIPNITKTKIEAYKDLNTVLVDSDGDSEIIIASPNNKPCYYSYSKEQVAKKNIAIEKAIRAATREDVVEELRFDGVLNGILTMENRFEFTSNEGKTYKGFVGDSIDLNSTFLINGKEYSVVIEKRKSSNGKVAYTLKAVDEPIHLV